MSKKKKVVEEKKVRVDSDPNWEEVPFEIRIGVMGANIFVEEAPADAPFAIVGMRTGDWHQEKKAEDFFMICKDKFCKSLREQQRGPVVEQLNQFDIFRNSLLLAIPKSSCEVISQ